MTMVPIEIELKQPFISYIIQNFVLGEFSDII